jgi:integrase
MVPMTHETARVLRAWRDQCRAAALPVTGPAPVWRRALRAPQNVRDRWNLVRTALGGTRPHLRTHSVRDFRHDCALSGAKAGASVQDVQLFLGHKRPQTTLRDVAHWATQRTRWASPASSSAVASPEQVG